MWFGSQMTHASSLLITATAHTRETITKLSSIKNSGKAKDKLLSDCATVSTLLLNDMSFGRTKTGARAKSQKHFDLKESLATRSFTGEQFNNGFV